MQVNGGGSHTKITVFSATESFGGTQKTRISFTFGGTIAYYVAYPYDTESQKLSGVGYGFISFDSICGRIKNPNSHMVYNLREMGGA